MGNQWKQVRMTKDPDELLVNLLGRSYRVYRNKWQMASGFKQIYDYPVHLDFELNFGCNLKCPQCILQANVSEFAVGHPYHKDTKKNKISFEKFKEIIDEGAEHGLCSITIGVNNEPLINPDLEKFIKYAKRKGIIDIILITNGILLIKSRSLRLIKSGLTKLYFSIDAINEDTYRRIRKGGDLKQVMTNINNFLELKRKLRAVLPITRVSFVKSKVNSAETEEFINYWTPRVDFVCLQAFMPPVYQDSKYKDIIKMFQIENSDLKSPGPCPQPYQRLTIYHDGSVHPCCNWPGATLIAGNIHSDSIHAIWNSDKMKKMRIAANDLENMPRECAECRMLVFGKVN